MTQSDNSFPVGILREIFDQPRNAMWQLALSTSIERRAHVAWCDWRRAVEAAAKGEGDILDPAEYRRDSRTDKRVGPAELEERFNVAMRALYQSSVENAIFLCGALAGGRGV